MGVSVTRARGSARAGPPLSAEGKLRRAGTRREDARFVTGRNTANPRIGSRAQQTCTVGEEKAAEVVRNHEGGTRERLAVDPRRARGDADLGAGLFDVRRWRGDLWKSQERKSSRKAGPQGSGRDGKAGVKVRRVACARIRVWRIPVVRTSRARVHLRKGMGARPRRGAVKPDTAESTGGDPPVEGPRRAKRTARIRSPRESAAPSERVWREPHAVAPR
jgi:hypothetical protein